MSAVGKTVSCTECGKPKKPIGRDLAAAASSWCTSDNCDKYWHSPFPVAQWPGEKEVTLSDTPLGRQAFSLDARNCLLCRHIDISFGVEGYSDLTPGSPGYVSCTKDVFDWQDEIAVVGACDLVKLVRTAETCEKFEPSSEALAMLTKQ